MIKEAIEKIVSKQDLTYDEAYTVMNEIMNGETTQVQNAAYLAALSTKSTKAETIDEISGSAMAMRDHALKVEHEMDVLDIVGTGGDHAHSINISTTAAMIIAAALGVNLDQPPAKVVEELEKIGICFMFAQKYHASMKYVGAIRKELGIRTVFNILGPLTNPAHPTRMILGVYDEYLLEPLANVLLTLGDGWYRRYTLKPEDFGFTRCTKDDIRGGDPAENAAVTLAILKGAQGPKTDIVLLNAGAAIYVGGKAKNIAEGIEVARQMIASGAALKKLEEFKQLSNA